MLHTYLFGAHLLEVVFGSWWLSGLIPINVIYVAEGIKEAVNVRYFSFNGSIFMSATREHCGTFYV
jgi:hypothetical protein